VTVEALCDDSALLSTGTDNNAAEVRSQLDGIAATEGGRAREKEAETEMRLAYAQALNEMKTSEMSAQRISLRRARMWQASPARVTLRVAAVALSASCAALVSETILQGSLRLQSPEFTLESPLLEMPFYLGLGVLAGALAILVRADDD
jgi:hydroxypyruvate isomerase